MERFSISDDIKRKISDEQWEWNWKNALKLYDLCEKDENEAMEFFEHTDWQEPEFDNERQECSIQIKLKRRLNEFATDDFHIIIVGSDGSQLTFIGSFLRSQFDPVRARHIKTIYKGF